MHKPPFHSIILYFNMMPHIEKPQVYLIKENDTSGFAYYSFTPTLLMSGNLHTGMKQNL